MSLDFGNMGNQAKSICFNVPNIKPILDKFKLPDLSNITLPKLGLPDFGKLNFGGGKLNVSIPTINLPSFNGLNFGGFNNFLEKLKGIKVPTTICINVGGDFGLESIFSQLGSAIDSLIPKPSFNLPPLIQGGQISIIPPILIHPTIPMDMSLSQALELVKANCLDSLLNKLRELDPLERLKQLMELAAELCSSMLFNQLKSVIEEIQKAQMEILSEALNYITDPIAKMLKLIDMATDAINSGSLELLQSIASLIGSSQYQGLLDFLDQLDPTIAITAVLDEIKNLLNLKNFGPIASLLAILQALKSKVEGLSNLALNALSLPELTLDQLQLELLRLLEQGDFLGMQSLLSDFMRFKSQLVDELRQLDPSVFLSKMLPMLNDALKNLEFGLFNMLIKDLADKLCGTNTLPT